MKITVENEIETNVNIKEIHVVFTHEVLPGESVVLDTNKNSYAVYVTYPDGQFHEKTKKTALLSGESMVTLKRQHDKGTYIGNQKEEELHLNGIPVSNINSKL